MKDNTEHHRLSRRIEVLEGENEALKHENERLRRIGRQQDACPSSEGEKRCREVIDSQRELICRFLPDGTLTFVNSSYCRFFKKSRDQLIGSSFFDLIPNEDHAGARAHLESITPNNPVKTFAHQVLSPRGKVRWQQWNDCGIFSKQGVLTEFQSVGRDITELTAAQEKIKKREAKLKALIDNLKSAEMALRQSEQRFKDLANLLPEAVFEMDLDGHLTYANKLVFKYFGYDHSDYDRGLSVFEMIHSDDRVTFRSNLGELLEGKEVDINEYTAVRKNGSRFPAWYSSAIIRQDGAVTGFRGFFIDVSEHKQKTAALELLQTAVEQVSDAIEITDSEGNMEYVNPALEKNTGYSHNELMGKNPALFKSGAHSDDFYDDLWCTIKSGRKWHGRFVNLKKDGTPIHEDTSISPVFNTNGKIAHFVAVKRDVTDEIKEEERMRQFQKMEALATLSGGIAHDFNNILGGVVGYVELCQLRLTQDSEAYRYLSEAIKGCIRAKKLIAQILEFSWTEEAECHPHKIHNVIEDALSLMRSVLPSTIKIQTRIDSTDMVALAPTQMHQVIMNLGTNALHAMNSSGGRLGVSLTKVELTAGDIQELPELKQGPYAKLSISDTGIGMDDETVKKIFDPYFSTKEKGRGTGLGLSVVHGIIRSCGGGIDVYSEQGVGTTFNIYFPVFDHGDAQESDTPPDEIRSSGTGEKILFIDDELVLVNVASQMLERLGYRVTTRTSPVEAIEAFKANPYDYDLVITDMTMPDMTGDELARKMKEIRLDIPIVLCTGFHHRINAEKASRIGISAFLHKPISMTELANVVTMALGTS